MGGTKREMRLGREEEERKRENGGRREKAINRGRGREEVGREMSGIGVKRNREMKAEKKRGQQRWEDFNAF